MIGMKSNPQADLQSLQPAMQPQMPSPMPMPQMVPQPTPGQPPAGWDPTTYQNFKKANPSLEPNLEDTAHMQAAGNTNSKGSIVKKAVKGAVKTAAGALAPGVSAAVGAATKAPAGMKWLLDYMQKRQEAHLDHERQILQQVLQQSKDRGGAAPESMKGHEQEYYDNVRNTGNRL